MYQGIVGPLLDPQETYIMFSFFGLFLSFIKVEHIMLDTSREIVQIGL